MISHVKATKKGATAIIHTSLVSVITISPFMVGGADRSRTRNPLRAKQALSQLSYSPINLMFPSPAYTQSIYSGLRSQGIRPRWRQTTILGHHTPYSVPQSISSCVGRFQGVS
jgi:hypothetical protein